MSIPETILLVGCGKMGSALMQGWIARGTDPAGIFVVDPDLPELPAGVGGGETPDAVPPGFAPGVVVVAVKPQVMDSVLPPYAAFAGDATVFMSIAAGRTIASLAGALGGEARLVRAMPNTPAAIGRGITVLYANALVDTNQRAQCETLMGAVGSTAWVIDEDLMDAVTAVSGSGPAYVFHLVEAMAGAGVAAGLPPDLAMQLARETVAGSGELLASSDEPVADLRAAVTSPGGTTEAALEVLMEENGLGDLMGRAIVRATERSRELAG